MHNRNEALSIFALLFISFGLPLGYAQNQKPARSNRSSAVIQAGALVSIDPASATLILKPRAGPEQTFRYSETTTIYRNKRRASVNEFTSGTSIVVRYRRSSAGPPNLYDLADSASWEWLDRVRHATTRVTIKEITEEYLHALEGEGQAEIEYRITERTQWSRRGKSVSPGDFKPGESVYVAPRLMARGRILAVAVSDAANSANILKERTRPTVTGEVTTVDLAARTLALRTVAGDARELALSPDCKVRQSSKDVSPNSLRAGQVVTAHLRRNEQGERLVTLITIQTKRGGKRASNARSGSSRP
jgi:hypothetical protein